MGEKRTLALKSLLLTALASAVVLAPVRAQIEHPREGLFDVRSASSAMVAGVHELEARLQLILSAEALDALNSGVPLTIELNVEVIRVRGLWLDDLEAEQSRRHRYLRARIPAAQSAIHRPQSQQRRPEFLLDALFGLE